MSENRANASDADASLEEFSDNQGYRAYVGPPEFYDVFSALQFNLLTTLGLRDTHDLLDIGCGSLRAGRLFIPYLRPGRYCGLEPVPELIEEGLANELGRDILEVKKPHFENDEDFTLEVFGRQFDFIMAQSIFSHTTQAQMRRCFEQAKKVLAPEGIFAATFFEGESDYEGDRWTVKAVFQMSTLEAMVEEAGLECHRIEWPHVDGQRWIAIRHRGAGPVTPQEDPAQELMRLRDELAFNRDRLWRLENSLVVRTARAVRNLARNLRYLLIRKRELGSEKQDERRDTDER